MSEADRLDQAEALLLSVRQAIRAAQTAILANHCDALKEYDSPESWRHYRLCIVADMLKQTAEELALAMSDNPRGRA